MKTLSRRVAVQFEARFFFPDAMTGTHWRWHRYTETLGIDVPFPGSDYVTHLPPPMFTYSAADLSRLRFHADSAGKITFAFERNAYRMFWDVPWRETSLWQQVRFDPMIPHPNGRPWTLRWRCPDAPNDLWAKTYAYLETQEDPEAQQLRREITLMMLGATV